MITYGLCTGTKSFSMAREIQHLVSQGMYNETEKEFNKLVQSIRDIGLENIYNSPDSDEKIMKLCEQRLKFYEYNFHSTIRFLSESANAEMRSSVPTDSVENLYKYMNMFYAQKDERKTNKYLDKNNFELKTQDKESHTETLPQIYDIIRYALKKHAYFISQYCSSNFINRGDRLILLRIYSKKIISGVVHKKDMTSFLIDPSGKNIPYSHDSAYIHTYVNNPSKANPIPMMAYIIFEYIINKHRSDPAKIFNLGVDLHGIQVSSKEEFSTQAKQYYREHKDSNIALLGSSSYSYKLEDGDCFVDNYITPFMCKTYDIKNDESLNHVLDIAESPTFLRQNNFLIISNGKDIAPETKNIRTVGKINTKHQKKLTIAESEMSRMLFNATSNYSLGQKIDSYSEAVNSYLRPFSKILQYFEAQKKLVDIKEECKLFSTRLFFWIDTAFKYGIKHCTYRPELIKRATKKTCDEWITKGLQANIFTTAILDKINAKHNHEFDQLFLNLFLADVVFIIEMIAKGEEITVRDSVSGEIILFLHPLFTLPIYEHIVPKIGLQDICNDLEELIEEFNKKVKLKKDSLLGNEID